MMKSKKNTLSFILGLGGAFLLFFAGWEYNIPLVPWVALPLLIYHFRTQPRWYRTLPVAAVAVAAKALAMHGGWDLDTGIEIAFAFVVGMPLLAALYLDRHFSKKMNPLTGTLVFPIVYILLDYCTTFANLGMACTLAYTQCTFLELIQLSSLLGSWAVGFLVAWFAPVAVLVAVSIHELKKTVRTAAVFAVCIALAISFGALRLVFDRPESATVRIASVTVEHGEDYWSTITDKNTPRGEAEQKKPEMAQIRGELFGLSKDAAKYGAKIIFWSEGNAPLYEDDHDEFLAEARQFASENGVYFIPAAVVFNYDRAKSDNIAIIINPQGEVEYRYEKTISWYPTDSDGRIPVIQTPYGKISTAICFDMDYPSLIRQAKDADIMLVPGYDTKKRSEYHTRVAFLRGVENGFSIVRQANDGTSISADYMGNTLAYQKFFYTQPRVMISDVPTQGKWTLYGLIGDVFLLIAAAALLMIFVVKFAILGKKKKI
jgi:apolipoprotein N-acyltransferase